MVSQPDSPATTRSPPLPPDPPPLPPLFCLQCTLSFIIVETKELSKRKTEKLGIRKIAWLWSVWASLSYAG